MRNIFSIQLGNSTLNTSAGTDVGMVRYQIITSYVAEQRGFESQPPPPKILLIGPLLYLSLQAFGFEIRLYFLLFLD